MIDLGDERGRCVGAVHCDFPDEPLTFPCYALFLDPGNALIIRSKSLERHADDQDGMSQSRLVPKRILSTGDLHPSMRRTPKGGVIVWLRNDKMPDKPRHVQVSDEEFRLFKNRVGGKEGWENSLINESNHVIRFGVGVFIKEPKELADEGVKADSAGESSSRLYDPKVDGKLTLENVLHVKGDESWGEVTNEDAKIPVAIF